MHSKCGQHTAAYNVWTQSISISVVQTETKVLQLLVLTVPIVMQTKSVYIPLKDPVKWL